MTFLSLLLNYQRSPWYNRCQIINRTCLNYLFRYQVASLSSAYDHMMDAISQCEQLHCAQGQSEGNAPWRLFYRKELFSPWEDTVGDIMAISLTFAQIVRGIMIGEYTCQSVRWFIIQTAKMITSKYKYLYFFFVVVREESPGCRLFGTASMLEWLRNLLPTTRRGAVYGKMQPKYPEGGHFQSSLRPQRCFNVPLYFK